MGADDIDFGVNFETGEITRPAPDPPAGDTDTEFNAFDDEPAGQDPAGKPPAAPNTPSEETIPMYRFNEVNQRLQQAAEREKKMLAFIENLTSQRQPQQPQQPTTPPTPPTPEEAAKERIRQQLLSVIPEFGEFLKIRDKIPQLLNAADAIPRIQSDTERYWGTVADSALNGVVSKLGETLGHAIEPRSMLGRLATQAFFEFVATNPQTQARYEAQDQSLIADFVTMFDKELNPVRARQQQQQRVEQVRKLPVAGRTSPPPSAQPPKPNMDNEDEVFAAGWNAIVSGRQGTGQ
jgi:hypothetical protein